MDDFTIGLVYTGGLLVMVFAGVRVFAAAAMVGLTVYGQADRTMS